jgi:predicted MPP superfamily phosphohydrolase
VQTIIEALLTYDQSIPALIFVTLVTLVYVIAIRNLILTVKSRLAGPRRQSSLWNRIIGVLALAGAACMAYGYFVEPYWPEVTHVELRSAKIAKGRTIRIAHISDLHSDPAARLEPRLPEIIAKEKPDVILFSGDAVNSAAGLPVFRAFMAELSNLAPTYAVKGNWDAGTPYSAAIFEGTGVHELNGPGIPVAIGANRIWITGASVSHGYEIPSILTAVPRDVFSIFVYHYPDEIYTASSKVDLYCAGHTHGGQVALPGYGALVTLSRFGKRFESGLFHVGDTALYVNRGIGMEGGSAPRVRFWARPEITVYEISAGP